jgi:hypothetical protein
MNREAVQQRIEEIGDCGCGADKAYLSCPCMNERDEILAEFDRLKLRGDTLQAQLAKICLPIKGTQRSSTRGGRGCSDSDREAVDRICAYLDSHDDFHGNNLVGRDLAAYLAKQKPSEKQPKYHNAIRSNIQGLKDYRGVWHEGGIEDCPTCNPPKCEHKNLGPLALGGTQRCLDCHEWIIAKPPPCPECQGTKYINRVVAVAEWEQHPCYMIADCLNCSGAKG